MSGLYDDFEKRHTDSWFPAGWVEVEVKKPEVQQVLRKDLATLQSELEQIEESIKTISQKQLRLSNLAKLYE